MRSAFVWHLHTYPILIGSQQVSFFRTHPLFSFINKTGFLIGYKYLNLSALMLLTLPSASNSSTTMANKISLADITPTHLRTFLGKKRHRNQAKRNGKF